VFKGLIWILHHIQNRSTTVSTMTSIYTGRSGIRILAEARDRFLHQNIQTISSAHSASNSMKTRAFSLTVKWPEQSDHYHLTRNKFSKSVELHVHSTCLPPWQIVGQLYFTFTSYLCTSLSRGHILSGLVKEPFYTSLTPYMQTT